MVTECEVVSVSLRGVREPKFTLSPYSICESAGRSVCQAIVTVDDATEAVSMAEMRSVASAPMVVPPALTVVLASGAVVVTAPETSAAVVNVLSGLTAVLPISSADRTRK